jgi:hypothetical protein
MESSKDTLGFWDSVSQVYETSDMTHCGADYELDIVFDLITRHPPENLVCIGVADGCRDPLQLLYFMENTGVPLPKAITLNDLSGKMLKLCEKRLEALKKVGPCTTYVQGPLQEIELVKDLGSYLYCMGCYNATYIIPALNLYQANKSIIGTHFTLIPYFFKEGVCSPGDKLVFDIENFEEHETKLVDMSKHEEFMSFFVETNTGFISHYYSKTNFAAYLRTIFKTCSIEVLESSRYLVNIITKGDGPHTGLITTLNNVIGNIPPVFTTKALTNIYDSYFS